MERRNSQGDNEAVGFKLLEKVIIPLHALLKQLRLNSFGQLWAPSMGEI